MITDVDLRKLLTLKASMIHGLTVQLSSKSYPIHFPAEAGVAIQAKLAELTKGNIGKRGNIVLNGRILSSAFIQDELGAEMVFHGIGKAQADQFIQSLNLRKNK